MYECVVLTMHPFSWLYLVDNSFLLLPLQCNKVGKVGVETVNVRVCASVKKPFTTVLKTAKNIRLSLVGHLRYEMVLTV